MKHALLLAVASVLLAGSPCDCPWVQQDIGDRPYTEPCVHTFEIVTSIAYLYPINADVTWDGVVNVEDMLTVLANWGIVPEGYCSWADANDDQTVNILDLLLVLGDWGRVSGGDCGC